MKRRRASTLAYFDQWEEALEELKLTEKEADYLKELLKEPHLEEEDADLALSLFRETPEEIYPYIEQFAISFPHLAKNIWSFCKHIEHKDLISEFITNAINNDSIQEYQLFWFAWILQDHCMGTDAAPSIISDLFNHNNSTTITKAKILEITDNRFGLVEMRDEQLVAGRSDWLSWASAVGHRKLAPISRNHKLQYFGNSSPTNHLIKTIVEKS